MKYKQKKINNKIIFIFKYCKTYSHSQAIH